MTEQFSRRFLMLSGFTGAVGLAASGAAALPAMAEQAIPFSDEPFALLAEHRWRAARFFAIEAHYQRLDDIAYQAVVGSFPPDYVAETAEEVETAFADYDRDRQPREYLLIVAKSHVANIDRRLWAIPASTYDDLAIRAELAEFWNRGWGFHDHHGYEDPFADRRLADAVLIDQPPRPSSLAFEPPQQLLDYRRIQEAWWVDSWRRRRGGEHLDHDFKFVDRVRPLRGGNPLGGVQSCGPYIFSAAAFQGAAVGSKPTSPSVSCAPIFTTTKKRQIQVSSEAIN